MIRVTWYFPSGSMSHANDFQTVDAAFEALTRTEMDAHAYPVGTDKGLYNWQNQHTHSLAGFAVKMDAISAPLESESDLERLRR